MSESRKRTGRSQKPERVKVRRIAEQNSSERSIKISRGPEIRLKDTAGVPNSVRQKIDASTTDATDLSAPNEEATSEGINQDGDDS